MPAQFIDASAPKISPPAGWDPIVVPKALIDAEIQRLADGEPGPDGLRAARIAHPRATAPGWGMAPDIAITIQVLRPGEQTRPIRQNSSQVSLCIRGSGRARIGGATIDFGRFDVFNTPAMHPYAFRNDGDDLQVRLTYSNAAMLETLQMHYVERMPEQGFELADIAEKMERTQRAKELAAAIHLPGGAELLTYEHLISPEVVPNSALHWRWADIMRHRDEVFPAGALDNLGRRGLFALYNPATGRTVGNTHSFFATIGFMPPDVLDFPHRHSSNAINYAIDGGFVSEVDGQRLEWNAGDIAFTAPSWSAHANGGTRGGIALTIQDHPLQIAMESLVWQEGEGKPILLLGAQQGFESDDSIILGERTDVSIVGAGPVRRRLDGRPDHPSVAPIA